MANPSPAPEPDKPTVPPPPPPRAFTQGVGTVFQVVGSIMFLALATVCCGSSLLSKSTAERPDLMRIGWGQRSGGEVVYSAQRAISVGMFVGVGLSAAVASVGLGLQATHRSAAVGGVVVTAFGLVFWIVHLAFAARVMGSVLLPVIAGGFVVLYAVLFALGVAAWREMRRHPPPAGHEVLPEGYKVPYSWYHEDPPEVRLARELEQRRERLAVQQKELEMLEERLKKRQAGEE
jgi:hypothetical protein